MEIYKYYMLLYLSDSSDTKFWERSRFEPNTTRTWLPDALCTV